MPLTGVGGVTNEPALSIANDTLMELLSEPFPWKTNRKEPAIFVTVPNKQDYVYSGACAFVAPTSTNSSADAGGFAIDLLTNNGVTQVSTTVTVKLLESCLNCWQVGDTVYLTGLTQSALNAVFTKGWGNSATSSGWSNGFTIATIAADGKSFTFTYAPAISTDGAPGITDLGWLEHATMQQTSSTAVVPFVWQVSAVRTLFQNGHEGLPLKFALKKDNGDGTIVLRLERPAGAQPMTIQMTYQAKPTILAGSDLTLITFSPIPDNYVNCIRQMFLALALRYAESPKADVEYQKALALCQKATAADDREDSEEYVTPAEGILGDAGWGDWVW